MSLAYHIRRLDVRKVKQHGHVQRSKRHALHKIFKLPSLSPHHSIKVVRLLCMIVSCTLAMVSLSRLVSVALVK